jgi:hypothetical protein
VSRAASRGTEPAGAATVCDWWSRGEKQWRVGRFRKTEREMGQAQHRSAGRRRDLNLNFKQIQIIFEFFQTLTDPKMTLLNSKILK